MKSIYGITVRDANCSERSLSEFRGKVLLIVNTASLCGYTPQYRELETLYQRYKDDGLVVLAFPCNQFAKEEPLPIKQVVADVCERFGVTFPIFNKIMVNGDRCEPLYEHLKAAQPGKLGFRGVMWNFEKFVVDREGNVVYRFLSEVTPMAFEKHLQVLLAKNL